MKSKQLQKGLVQLVEEGAAQVFRPLGTSQYILGAVGALQFDVTSERLKTEYGAETVYEPVRYVAARWVHCEDQRRLKEFTQHNGRQLAHDAEGHLAYLAPDEWRLENTMEEWPDVAFHKTREYN